MINRKLLYEIVNGVSINNDIWTITNTDGTTRNVQAGPETGWITKLAMEQGPYFDMVPTDVSGGSENTYYADKYTQSKNTSLILARSYASSATHGGVACAYVSCGPSNKYASFSSRLSFRGTIEEAENITAFKQLPIL